MGDLPQPDNSGEDVVTLCGSTRFKNEYEKVCKELISLGWIVRSVELYNHADDLGLSKKQKEKYDETHKVKIQRSDAIFVVDVDGYIGKSTKEEISLAEEIGLDVYYLSEFE